MAKFEVRTMSEDTADITIESAIDIPSCKLDHPPTNEDYLKIADQAGVNWLFKKIHRYYSFDQSENRGKYDA